MTGGKVQSIAELGGTIFVSIPGRATQGARVDSVAGVTQETPGKPTVGQTSRPQVDAGDASAARREQQR